ncbi:MAG TPA: hypothetical protein VGE22_04835 [Solimonas sp.]
MAAAQNPQADEAYEAELESSAARIAQIIAAAAYEMSVEVSRWPEELREQAAMGFRAGRRAQ